jgi:hypothetical protein
LQSKTFGRRTRIPVVSLGDLVAKASMSRSIDYR